MRKDEGRRARRWELPWAEGAACACLSAAPAGPSALPPPNRQWSGSSALSLVLLDRSCFPAVAILVPVVLAYLVCDVSPP